MLMVVEARRKEPWANSRKKKNIRARVVDLKHWHQNHLKSSLKASFQVSTPEIGCSWSEGRAESLHF